MSETKCATCGFDKSNYDTGNPHSCIRTLQKTNEALKAEARQRKISLKASVSREREGLKNLSSMAKRTMKAEAERDRLRVILKEVHTEMVHAYTFVSTSQKMAKVGRDQFGDVVAKIEALNHKEG